MADIVLAEQSTPATPSSGNGNIYFDSTSSELVSKNDAGVVKTRTIRASVVQQAAYSADTYITNSGLVIPSNGMQAGTVYTWEMPVTKTAGTAAPVFTIRIGANQTTADTSRLAITLGLQTAVVDTGSIRVTVTCRNVGAAGVLQGNVWLQHNLQITGLATTPSGFSLVQGTSAAFDNSALGGQFIGLSINSGASGAWVHEQMIAEVRCG